MRLKLSSKQFLHYGFYVGAIGGVFTLFQLVALYGERHLQAPPDLNGRYLSASPPGCPNNSQLVLTLQQSGIYLNGFLTLEESAAVRAESVEEKPSLHGLWRKEEMLLTGQTTALQPCAIPATAVAIQGKFIPPPQASLNGQLSWDENPQPWPFTAQRQAAVKAQDTAH